MLFYKPCIKMILKFYKHPYLLTVLNCLIITAVAIVFHSITPLCLLL